MSLTTSAICRLVNIKPETLRTWERRYSALSPQRDQGGRRVYGGEDVERLKLLVELVQNGHAISRLAPLATSELKALVPNDNAPWNPTPAYEHVLAATLEYDLMEVRRQIALSLSGLSPLEACERVLAPLLREIGERWEDGLITVAHEHAVSAVVKQLLYSVMPPSSGRATDNPVICCTLEGDIHEIGSLMSAYLISAAGLPILNLGPNLPVANLVEVAGQTQAQAISISSVYPNEKTDFRGQIKSLAPQLPAGTELWLGGPNAEDPGISHPVRLFRSLGGFDAHLSAHVAMRAQGG